MESFNYWFNNTGHWIYESREAAMKQWKEFGILGLPKYKAA